MTPLVFVMICLASWRLTTLVTTDTITRPFRMWLAHRYKVAESPHPLVVLSRCARCLSVWVSLAVVVAAHLAGLAPDRAVCVLGWWAAAGAAGWLADTTG